MSPRSFDSRQQRVLEHARGPMLVLGGAGTGKTAALIERFARLVESGANPERVALVVRSRAARSAARRALLARLPGSLPALRVATVHGIAYQVVQEHHKALEYEGPPAILSAADQFERVRDLLQGDDPNSWPAYGSMLGLRGFADEVRQFLLRAQEALLSPEDIERRAKDRGLAGWPELAGFYRRYLQVLDQAGLVDFAGLVMQAAAVAPKIGAPFDHVLVDDFQDTTYAAEALVSGLAAESTVVAGDPDAHVFAFQGTTDVPIRRYAKLASAQVVELTERHRGAGPATEAWWAPHASEEYEAVARELRRVHVEDGVPWRDLAVLVRRQGAHLGGLLRALDDAAVPRWLPERTLSSVAEPATHPYLLALRWIARPEERPALIESVLASDLAGLPPAAARSILRTSRGGDPSAALAATAGLTADEAASMDRLRSSLEAAEKASASVLDAFAELWRSLPYSAHLVARADASPEARRDLDAVVAFAERVAQAAESGDPSVEAFLADHESGEEGPGIAPPGPEPDAVSVLTAHGSAGREFDTVFVVRTLEGNFPSLSRPEPMFDLESLERSVTRSERLRERVADERRLFRMVVGRARRRAVFTGGAAHEESRPVSRSRFVEEAGVAWQPVAAAASADGEPLTVAEAASGWRRALADPDRAPAERLAALEGLLALGTDPGRWWYQRDWTETGRPLHESLRVSYSRLDKLENCELQFVLSEELGLGSPSGYHAWVGSLVHDLIEQYENGQLPERTLDALQAAAEARWRPEEFPSHAVSEAFRRLVRDTMLPNWFHEYERVPSVAREERFEFEFDGATVTGYIDRIGPITSGGNRITDYKTGKVPDGLKPDDNLQLGLYFLAVDETENLAPYRPVRAVELAYLRGKWNDSSRPHRAQWQPNSQHAQEYRAGIRERLSGLLARLRTLVETETYRPNTQANCFFCEFKPLCPLYPQGAPLFPELAVRTAPAAATESAEAAR